MRYVVLHHTGIENPHFDFMFESSPDGPLETLRCGDWPPTHTTKFERLADHRRAYLEYEGPISGGRGKVRRVASGTFNRQGQVLQLDNGERVRIPPPASAGA